MGRQALLSRFFAAAGPQVVRRAGAGRSAAAAEEGEEKEQGSVQQQQQQQQQRQQQQQEQQGYGDVVIDVDAMQSEEEAARGEEQNGEEDAGQRGEKLRLALAKRAGEPHQEAQGGEMDVPDKSLTPLELQWKQLKVENPDVLLCVECGYRYQMFGEDAAVAAKVLSIGAFKSRAFLQTSFPLHRLSVHVRRLVEQGHLVGVVKQTETAALKKHSDSKNKLFTRQLTALFSRATFVEDALVSSTSGVAMRNSQSGPTPRGPNSRKRGLISSGFVTKSKRPREEADEGSEPGDMDDAPESETIETEPTPEDGDEFGEQERILLIVAELDQEGRHALADAPSGGWHLGDDRPKAAKVSIGLLAVDVQTGRVHGDAFVDDAMRAKLRQRLVNFDPVEFVLPGPTMSAETEALFAGLGPRVRVHRFLSRDFTYVKATSAVTDFYATQRPALLGTVLEWPVATVIALAAGLAYLERFGLQQALCPADGFQMAHAGSLGVGGTSVSNSSGSRTNIKQDCFMQLDAGALQDLEVVATRGDTKYSLVHFLTKHTLTPMGNRMLRDWTLAPLFRAADIKDRQEAALEIAAGRGTVKALEDLLRRQKRVDLERTIERAMHGRCSPSEFALLSDRLLAIMEVVDKLAPDSAVLKGLFVDLGGVAEELSNLLRGLDKNEMEHDRLSSMFVDAAEYHQVAAIQGEISRIQAGFADELSSIRQILKQPGINFRTLRTGVSSVLENLIELPKAHAVPKEWTEVSSTQRLARYTTPVVESLLAELARKREELGIQATATWKQVLEKFSSTLRVRLRRLVAGIAKFDALAALGKVSQLPGFVTPTISAGDKAFLDARDLRHPLLEDLAKQSDAAFVPNDACLGTEDGRSARVQLVTGPNMGGKSSFCRQAALCIILAQIGSSVPASKCSIGPFDAVRVRMGVKDDPIQGMSTFLVELRQAADCLNHATSRTLCILDELGRGTSTRDGSAIATATLRFFCQKLNCRVLFISHFADALSKLQAEFDNSVLQAFHMDFHNVDDGKVVFLFKAKPGVADQSYGLNVAALAGIPPRILDAARAKAEAFRADARIARPT